MGEEINRNKQWVSEKPNRLDKEMAVKTDVQAVEKKEGQQLSPSHARVKEKQALGHQEKGSAKTSQQVAMEKGPAKPRKKAIDRTRFSGQIIYRE